MPPVTILLVEDAPGDTQLVKEALEACAIPVTLKVAEDGEQALFFLKNEEIKLDLVILDLNIPKVSGISVLEQYLPAGKPAIVVFSSTWSETEIHRVLALGAREVVHKPIDMRAFREAVCGMVNKWCSSLDHQPIQATATVMSELTEVFPIIPHKTAGVDCSGCIVVNVRGNDAELSCNQCGAVVGVINREILVDLIELAKA